jgi:hypothetical protein
MSPLSLHDSPRGEHLRQSTFQKDMIPNMNLCHRLALTVSAHKSHTKLDEVV